MVRDLTDPERALCGKNKDAALELKQKGNRCFLNEDYASALTCYSEVSTYLDDVLSSFFNYKGKLIGMKIPNPNPCYSHC